ncbi:unnamed protein product [Discosporangium mesarthrocarpum]
MDKEVVFVPINGQPVPFSIHTIKNVAQPDPDNHSFYLRINFFSAGSALGKEASRKMSKLVEKHGPNGTQSTYVKELMYRSLERSNLDKVFRQIQELRKRLRTREQKAVEEADLVIQAKLIRTRDQRVPRLQDLTMRPTLSGKTIGSLEAHQNGLRFISQKHETVDILYSNIKHAFYQPCSGTFDTKVILHFSLRHPIMVGKRAHKEIQVSTEAMDSTVNLDGAKKSHFDPDELVEEQRERQLRKRLDVAFKDFAAKVTKVAKANNEHLEFDIPFDQLGFMGTPHKEMVFIQPTTYALINVMDQPFLTVSLNEIEHVHFERVLSSSKTCDMKIIMKARAITLALALTPSLSLALANACGAENMLENGGEPVSINMIDQNKYLNKIMSWLMECNVTYTQSAKPFNWKAMMADIRGDDRFYLDTEKDGEKKPAGWARLKMDDSSEDEEEEEDGESDFEAQTESDDSDDDDDDESMDDDESESGYEDEEEELEEKGMSWDELEAQASRDDRSKRDWDGGEEPARGSSKKKQKRR